MSDNDLVEKVARTMCKSWGVDICKCESACEAPLRNLKINGKIAEARAAIAVVVEECERVAGETAKGFRAYRDHYPHAEGAESAVAAIRALKPGDGE